MKMMMSIEKLKIDNDFSSLDKIEEEQLRETIYGYSILVYEAYKIKCHEKGNA